MQFFELTHPSYASDAEYARRNPVRLRSNHRIPSIVCRRCGIWASSARIRVSSPASTFARRAYLDVAQWTASRDPWARDLDVHPEVIEPGASVGPPTGVATAELVDDIVHPFPGSIWVSSRVRTKLSKAKPKGLAMVKVRLSPKRYARDLWELVVHGRSWRVGSTIDRLRACKLCGRTKFPAPTKLAVDEDRWDGSDFTFVDNNPNIVIVTERIATLFADNDFTNIVAIPIQTQRARKRRAPAAER